MNKRRVTMRSTMLTADGATADHEAVDYVPEEILDSYVADARTRWQYVEIGDEVDDGPGGPDAEVVVPAHLDHPLAGEKLT